MANYISVNLKKIKASTRVNALIGENYRDMDTTKQYDNGRRVLDTDKTADNVYLLDRPEDYDQMRRERIEYVNDARAQRAQDNLRMRHQVRKLKADGTYSKEIAATRKLRSDTVDTLGIVVQPSADFINSLSRPEQIQFFRDALSVMQADPDYYGEIQTAVIHMDEQTPHMQCLASTISKDTLTSEAKKIYGNKTKMSNRQTRLADAMQQKGWTVERGMKRINNPDYRNFADDMRRMGIEINRHNDAVLYEQWEQLHRKEISLNQQADSVKVAMGKYHDATVKLDAKIQELNTRQDEAVLVLNKAAGIKQRENNVTQREIDVLSRESDMDTRDRALKLREQSLLKQEQAQKAREDKLDAKEQNLLKTQNTVSESIDILNALMNKGLRLTESRKREIHKTLEMHNPVTEENLPDLTLDLQQLQKLQEQQQNAGISL